MEKDYSRQNLYDDLPTLDQVLTRKTLPPVCLYNFYIIMRDRLKMEEVLDFYLDLQHHEQLWKRYVKAMHRTGHLSEMDLSEGYQSPRILSRLSHNPDTQSYTAPSSIISSSSPQDNFSLPIYDKNRTMLSPTPGSESHGDRILTTPGGRRAPSRKELADSSQRLLLRYLVPSATKEVTQLPPDLVVALRRELEKPDPRDDPLLFQEAKDYLFEYMQRQAYPKFLRLKVWGNITLYQQLGRFVLGLVSLLAALTTSLSLIFLGYPTWGVRFWILLPFWIGLLNLFVFLTGLDPIWVLLFNKSETTTFKFNSIKQPQVKRILRSRSIWLLTSSLILAIICTLIFCAIPPRRL
ncbi:Protein rax1 [Choanephora cucurbitarum]|uniref:Protein rax1 n=1 Tax=Choanephora cucurbitarum TaxID=101091 RepID=A0A1C7N463_9FUNG|nr:Protein rax1 [Choanephora cucurbitarum]